MNLSECLQKVGQPAYYYPAIAKIFGIKGSIFLTYFAWWTGKQHDKDGWIYKSQQDLSNELGMSQEEQALARKRLKKFGVLEEKYDRLQHTMYYRVNTKALDTVWNEHTKPETGKHGFGKPGNTVSTKPGNTVSTKEAVQTIKATTTTGRVDDVVSPLATGASPQTPASPSASAQNAWSQNAWLSPPPAAQKSGKFSSITAERVRYFAGKAYQDWYNREPNLPACDFEKMILASHAELGWNSRKYLIALMASWLWAADRPQKEDDQTFIPGFYCAFCDGDMKKFFNRDKAGELYISKALAELKTQAGYAYAFWQMSQAEIEAWWAKEMKLRCA